MSDKYRLLRDQKRFAREEKKRRRREKKKRKLSWLSQAQLKLSSQPRTSFA